VIASKQYENRGVGNAFASLQGEGWGLGNVFAGLQNDFQERERAG
jgi:hypothetical protein